MDKQIVSYAKALSNPTRLAIYKLILEEAAKVEVEGSNSINGNRVGIIAKKLRLGQPTVSNHVKELVVNGIVVTKKKGKKTYLYPDKKFLFTMKEFLTYIEQNIFVRQI